MYQMWERPGKGDDADLSMADCRCPSCEHGKLQKHYFTIDTCNARICRVLTAWAQSSLSIDGIENSAADISKSTFTSWQNKGHADMSLLKMPLRHAEWVSLADQHQNNHNLQAIKKCCMFDVMLTWRADAAPWLLVSHACCTLANFRPK